MNDELLTRAKVRDLDREALRIQRLREARNASTHKDHDGANPPSMTPRTPLSLLKEPR
ncbi:MAG: hypothetical protein IH957_02480 [Chloroflexi bacterium]|nr:hypothetical protein [Chloroflexota bacterium]